VRDERQRRCGTQVWDAEGLAALLDGANFIGHERLHEALCAALAADIGSACGSDCAAIRTRLALPPGGLGAAATAALHAALAACAELPAEALGAEEAAEGQASHALASLPDDTLRLIVRHLPLTSLAPAARACAGWARAGAAESAERLTVRRAAHARREDRPKAFALPHPPTLTRHAPCPRPGRSANAPSCATSTCRLARPPRQR
jgi:hypothetical protein